MRYLLPLIVAGFFIVGCQPSNENGDNGASADTATTATTPERPALKSPPDSAMATAGSLNVQVNYGSPAVRERVIWGDLVPYGELWRTGANEATTLTVSQDATIEGNVLPAGTYALFTIPDEETWTVVLNKDAEQWGSYEYNADEDVVRFIVTPESAADFSERMVFKVTAIDTTVQVTFHWAQLTFSFVLAVAS